MWVLREKCAGILDSYKPVLGHNEIEVLKAWTLGIRKGLPRSLKRSFKESGTYHIFAISGLHVMLFYGIIVFMLLFVRCPLFWTILFVMGALIVMVLLTGASPSVIRASFMVGLMLLTRAVGRSLSLVNAFWVALLVVLLINPLQVRQLSFQMSFLAVALIVLVTYGLPLWKRKRWPSFLRAICDMFLLSLALMLGMSPVTAAIFGQVALISPLSNLSVIPLMTLGIFGAMGILLGDFLGLEALLYLTVLPLEKAIMKTLLALVEFWGQWGALSISISKNILPIYYFLVLFTVILVAKINFFVKLSKSKRNEAHHDFLL